MDGDLKSAEAAATAVRTSPVFRHGRALAMTLAGGLLGLFACVHTVWTGFHAPLAAWIAPVALGLLAGGLWSLSTRRALPRWGTISLSVGVAVLSALVIASVAYALTRHDSIGAPLVTVSQAAEPTYRISQDGAP